MLSCAMYDVVDDEEDVHYSTEDLFELVWQANKGGGSRGGGGGSRRVSSLQQQQQSTTTTSSHHHHHQVVPAIPPLAASGSPPPPSEDAMAAWLYPIVSGHDHMHMHMHMHMHAGGGGDHTLGRQPAVAKEASSKGMKKAASGSASSCRKVSSDHYSRAHNLTEKKRRCRINEKLRTLQRLVPGCDKSNQVSTLEQTIQYMKSLQQQVQAMNTTCRPPPPAMYPAAVAMPTVAPAGPPAAQMVPFLAMLPYPHYQAMITHAAAPHAGAVPGGGPAHHTHRSVSVEQHQPHHKKEKQGRRL